MYLLSVFINYVEGSSSKTLLNFCMYDFSFQLHILLLEIRTKINSTWFLTCTVKFVQKGGGSKDGGAEDKRRGKKKQKEIPQVTFDKYSGRLKEIDGRTRGPIPASARAKREKLMHPNLNHSETSESGDETPPFREDSYQTPGSIGTDSMHINEK